MRSQEAAYAEQAATHQANAGFLNTAREAGEIDMQEASDRGLVDVGAEPHQDVSTVPVERVGETNSGQGVYTADYQTIGGEQRTFDVTGTHDTELEFADNAANTSNKWAQRTSDARTTGRGVKQLATTAGNTANVGGKAVVVSGKIGAAAMLGGATRSPYLSHRIGRSVGRVSPTSRARNVIIGSNSEGVNQSTRGDESRSASTSAAVESEVSASRVMNRMEVPESDIQPEEFDEGDTF
jgi:hypothetical protein